MGRRDAKARRSPKARPQGVLELTPRGFGFVKTAEGEFFIPESKINGAFPGDLVEVSRISSQRQEGVEQRRPTGRVSKVIMREQHRVIGHYEVAEPFGVVIPDDPCIPYDIFTLRRDAPHAKDGDVVEVEMVEYPSRSSAATGRVVRILGHEDDSSIEVDLIIAQHDLATEFSEAAKEQAASLVFDYATPLAQGYADRRDRLIYTIDPVDARDYDDAVSCSFEDGRWHLGVYIADVSHYVPFSSSIDLEARGRATSVYLVDRVLPMLPERISNDLCSLVPAEPRLSLAVEAVIRADGMVESFEVLPAVIQSKARLSYDQALALLDAQAAGWGQERAALAAALASCEHPQGAKPIPEDQLVELASSIDALKRLSKRLFALRHDAGCMDFERVEARVKLDESGIPVGVSYRTRNDATQAIEEAMILANRLVAQWLIDQEFPCVHRVHDEPDGDALYALYRVLSEMPGYDDLDEWSICSGAPSALQELLARSRGKAEQELVNFMLLRSMKRAVYQVDDAPHYGLALQHYCHFTSPIRRYPDLLVHRMVKAVRFGRSGTHEAQVHQLPWMAEHSSKMERVAEKASYQSQMLKLVEYLQKDIGQTFEGIIAGVSTFGLTVRLQNTATGRLPLARLGEEYFSYDPDHHLIQGADTGTTYRLGQPIWVVLTDADPHKRRLTFKLAARR